MSTANRDHPSEPSTLRLDDPPRVNYGQAIRRHVWLVALVVILALVITAIVTAAQDRVYRASTSFVVVQPGDTASRSQIADIGLTQTVAGLAETDVVAAEVIAKAGLDTTPEKFLKKLNVTVRPSASVVDVTFDANQRERATEILDVMSAVFIARVKNDLVAKRSNSTNTEALLDIKTFSAPHVQPDPIAPRPARTLVFAGIISLIAGLLLALLRERSDDRIRDREDAQRSFGAPVIGALPEGWRGPPEAISGRRGPQRSGRMAQRPGPSGGRHAGEARVRPWNAIVERLRLSRADPDTRRELVDEALQLLSLSIEALRDGGRGTAIVVTSTRQEEGKSTVVANLGTSLARGGMSVLCVEVDAHGPMLHQFLNVEPAPVGLVQVARLDAEVRNAVVNVPVRGLSDGERGIEARGSLRILTLGDPGASLSAALGEDEIALLVDTLRAEADFVIFDTSPLGFGEAHRLIRAADVVLLVARRGLTRRVRAQAARAILERLGVRRAAVVLTDADASESLG